MRYVVLNKKIKKEEIKERKEYIERTTNMKFICKVNKEGVEFISIPSSQEDCLMIVGHNGDVSRYLKVNDIKEKNIVVISCIFCVTEKMRQEKNIYVSFDLSGKTYFYDGINWNINYVISKEELKLLNTTGNFMNKIKEIFRRI